MNHKLLEPSTTIHIIILNTHPRYKNLHTVWTKIQGSCGPSLADIHADMKLIELIYQIKDNEEVNGNEVINGTCPVIHKRFRDRQRGIDISKLA